MRRWLRFARRAALVLLLLVLGVVVAVYGFSKTERFRTLVRDEIVTRGSDAIRGEITLGEIEGSIWSELFLRDVELREAGEVVARMPSVRLRYHPLALAFGRLRIEAVELERPVLFLKQDEAGEWNLLRAVAAATPAAGEPVAAEESAALPISVDLESFRIDSLEATVEPAGGEPVRIRDVHLVAVAGLGAAGVTASVEELRGRIDLPRRPPLRFAARLDWDGTSAPPLVGIRTVAVETEASRVELTGTVRGLETPEPDLRLVIRPLAAADVNVFAPGLGLRPDVTGEITLGGSLADLRMAMNLAAGEASLDATVTADATRDEPPWHAVLTLADLDVAKLLERDDASGLVEARLDARGRGGVPEAVSGGASVAVSNLAYADWRPGDVSLEARVVERRATIEARVDPGRGRATLAGDVDLSGSEAFDLRLVTENLAPLRTPDGDPSGDLSLEATFRGKGFSPETLDARIETTVKPSVLGDVSLDGARLEATARGGAAEGFLEASGLRYGESRFERARMTFDARELDQTTPSADVDLVVERLVAGVELRRLEIATETTAGERIDSTIRSSAVDREGRTHRSDAEMSLVGETVRLELTTLVLDLPGGEWRLVQPATIERRGDDVTIDRFLAKSDARSISLAGLVSASGRQDLVLEIDGVELEPFAPLLPRGFRPAGRVSSEVRLDGTAAAPVLEARLEARGLRASAVRADALDTTLSYRDGEASLRLDLRQDADHRLEARGRVPLEVAWAPRWTMMPATATELPLDVRVHSAGLDLSFLDAFGERNFHNVAGTLVLDVTVGGTGERPEPRGTIGLRDGQVDLLALGVKIRELGGDVAISSEVVRLERLSARAGEGRLEASGQVALADFVPGEVDARLTLERWPAIRTRQYHAILAGDVTARGPLDALDARGRLEVVSATLRPDLAFLGSQPPPRDETIVLVGRDAPKPERAPEEEDGPKVAETVNRYENLTLDLTVEMKRNVWVKQEGTSIELEGDVRVRKKRAGPLQVVGRILTRRGWARFQTKRFRIVEGEIRFTGGQEIDPLLDVVARHRVRGYTIDVVVGGRTSKPKLELRSSPDLDQADILSVLLFGKPTSQLTGSEQAALGDQAASIATTFAVAEVSREVTRALGIEDLGIQIEEVSTERAAVGAYVTERTYVSVAQDLAGKEGREVSVEYEILPPNWSVVTSTNTTGESSGDIIWKKRY